MSSLKSYEGFSLLSFIPKIVASALMDAFLKGEGSLPLSKLRDENIPEEELQLALEELHGQGIIQLPGKVLEGTIDSSQIAAIHFTGLSLGVQFSGNGQKSMFDKSAAQPKPEFDEGRLDHRIGHAVYRCLVTKGEVEEGEPINYLVNIDRFTLHPDHRHEGAELVFSSVRHIIEQLVVPSPQAGWNYWGAFVDERSGDLITTSHDEHNGVTEDSFESGDSVFALILIEKDGEQTAAVLRNAATEDAEDWKLVSSAKVDGTDEAYDFWENALDDISPAEKMATTQLTLEDGGAIRKDEEDKGDTVFAFDLRVGETTYSVTVFDTEDCHLYEAIYFDEKGVVQTLRQTNPQKLKTEGKAKTAATKWLEAKTS